MVTAGMLQLSKEAYSANMGASVDGRLGLVDSLHMLEVRLAALDRVQQLVVCCNQRRVSVRDIVDCCAPAK